MKALSYRYLPLNIFLLYSAFVFSALVFGPVKYYHMDYAKLFSFLLAFIVLFYFGFIFGAKNKNISFRGRENVSITKIKPLFVFFLYLSFALALKSWGVFILSGKSLSLASMGENYVNSYDGYERGQASIGLSYILNIIESAITAISLLLIFSHFRHIQPKSRYRYMCIFIIISYLLINVIGSGKQKYLGDVVIFLIYAYLIKIAALNVKLSIKKIGFSIFTFFSILALFSFVLYQRYAAINLDGTNISNALHPLMYWDDSSVIVKVFGDILGFAIGMFLGYFTNGLCGLNLSLQLPFEWTYFLGNSYSTAKIAEVFIGENGAILSHSYPFRAEELGWGLDKWHSIFSWLASDFTFFGVLLLSFLFAFAYGRLWVNSIVNTNPLARPLFVYLSLGIIFTYSNNQLVHSLSGVMTLLFLTLFYFICSKLTK